MLRKWYAHHNFTTLPPYFSIIRPIYKCEILTLQSDFSVYWTKKRTGEENFH